jgi:hypothetical protein
MKNNGDYELSDVPRLMRKWKESRGQDDWPSLLKARQALTDACGDLVDAAARETRGMTTGERRSFDEHMTLAGEINAALAKIKTVKIAEYGADQVNVPF